MKKRNFFLRLLTVALTCSLTLGGVVAQPEVVANAATTARQMEALSRGLVAVKTNGGVFLSWRLLGTESYSTKFNVYRNGVKIASNISDSTNYLDTSGSSNASYMVRAVVNGTETNQSDTVTPWSNNYKDVPINKPANTTLNGSTVTYSANDATVADVDGDGEYEIILKWDPSNAKDNSQSGYTSNVYVDCYEMDGTMRWRIDLGKNIRAGAHYTQIMAYDLNGDGKAEVAMKTADGTVAGDGTVIGDASKDYRNSSGYVLSGPEYLTLFEGKTGKVLTTIDYNPARGTVKNWGDSYGNRVDRFLAAVAYFDGKTPSLVVCRGYYTRSVIVSYEYKGGKLNEEWVFDTNNSGNSSYAGQGNHNLSIADVDGDGKDEIVYGSAVIDHDGTGLYTTGDGHGDALHVGDFDPDIDGLEIYQVHETKSSDIESIQLRKAKSGSTIWCKKLSKDIGRGLILNIDPDFYPYVTLASNGNYYTKNGTAVTSAVSGLGINFATYWDGDLYREGLDGTTIRKWDYNNDKVVTALSGSNVHSNNGTKSTPSLSGDILGDWREEVIWPTSDDTALRIYTTTDVTSEKLYTLMHDSQYRLSIAWQNVAYNQPPHTSYYVGPDMDTPTQPALYTVGSYTLPAVSGNVSTPTEAPTAAPTVAPTTAPTVAPTVAPTTAPTQAPSQDVEVATYVQNFTTDGKNSDFFSITGNLSTSKGTVSYNGLSLTQCLKMESSTNISFTVDSDAQLTLVFNSANSSNVKVDGTKYTLTDGILTMDIAAGTHTVTKANTANLFYMSVGVEGSSSGAVATATPAPTVAPTQAPTATPVPTAAPTAALSQESGVAHTGSTTITGANWWASKDISFADLLGDVDASGVTSIKFSGDTEFWVGYNSTSQYKQLSGQTEYTLTDINLSGSYYLQLCLSKNDNVNYTFTWEVYTD
ncbi:MAG: dockerin [Lachnospiraceae bacterium]|nr:dockerin [Lachnospiraceae bacterium]